MWRAQFGCIGSELPPPRAGEGWGEGCLRNGGVENCGGNPQGVRALTRRARDDASHRPGRVGLSRKRERRSKPAIPVKSLCDSPARKGEGTHLRRGVRRGSCHQALDVLHREQLKRRSRLLQQPRLCRPPRIVPVILKVRFGRKADDVHLDGAIRIAKTPLQTSVELWQQRQDGVFVGAKIRDTFWRYSGDERKRDGVGSMGHHRNSSSWHPLSRGSIFGPG
ncbi:hypothetical protein PMI42_05761 [Bradyrhizobium sp. YR681]|nr:hypothetical protein PMI42_05761 [Bradyrhizobium sp. YR681]